MTGELLAGPPTDAVKLLDGAVVEPQAIGTIYSVTIQTFLSDLLARDVVVVNPHFQDNAGTMTPAALATALGAAMTTYLKTSAFGGTVKVYLEDFNPGAPHVPLAVANFGTQSAALPNSFPREVALCLSYYATQNTKRWRGRIFLPMAWISVHMTTPPATLGERPTASIITGALDYASVVLRAANANGIQHVVASTVDKVARVVSDYWVDDEWDTVRRRGLKSTTRQTLHP